jgi:hypothetical protein
MKMKTERNDQAFPTIAADGVDVYGDQGLTKREYFAAMAMQGIISNSLDTASEEYLDSSGFHHHQNIALVSVQISEALINALNQE